MPNTNAPILQSNGQGIQKQTNKQVTNFARKKNYTLIVIRMSLKKNIFEVSHAGDNNTVSDTIYVARTRIYRSRRWKYELSLVWAYQNRGGPTVTGSAPHLPLIKISEMSLEP